MKKALILLAMISASHGFGQCPFPVQLVSTGDACVKQDTLIIESSQPITKIRWLHDAVIDTTLTARIVTIPLQNAVTVAGGNGAGAALNQFNSPSSLFVDAAGYMYVADRSNFRVMRFPPGSNSTTSGVVIAGGNGPGKELNQFQPNAIFVDGDGNLFVADDANSRVLKFPPNSTSETKGSIAAGGNGAGDAANQLVNPVGLFVDESKNLYVVDAFNDRIQKFSPGSSSQTNAMTIAGGNGYGDKANQFNGPAAIFVDKSGFIYVDDAANNRIQKFPPASTTHTDGITIAGGNGFGSALNQLSTPSSIWGDNNGNIYVADINNQRVQQFASGSTSATPGITVAGGNGQGSAANQFSGPNAVWGDNKGNLYISDIGNNRIQKFSLQPVKQYLIDTTLLAAQTGTYTAIITDTSGCSITTDAISVRPAAAPSVSIATSPVNIESCTRTKATYQFTATTTNGGNSPIFQWKINDSNTGGNTSSLKSEVANGDVISCLLISNAVCAIPSAILSNKIVVSFAAKPVVSVQNKGRACTGLDTMILHADNMLTEIAWYHNKAIDTIIRTQLTPGGALIDISYQPLNAGDYYAVATNTYGCLDTTDIIHINETAKPQVTILPDKENVCEKDTIIFTAVAESAGVLPRYQWQINNFAAGTNSPVYTSSSLQKGDGIRCLVYGDTTGCFGSDTSNQIVPLIYPLPQFSKTNDVFIKLGQTILLSVPVTGNIVKYAWQPAASLSNPTIAYPMATPLQTTVYTLHVLSSDECMAVDSIKVVVSSPIFIPSAFSPNKDGVNDVWYIQGGSAGNIIQLEKIYNRQGQIVFTANHPTFSDRTSGWDGTFHGSPMPPGTYIYEVIVASANNKKTYKGTLVLLK